MKKYTVAILAFLYLTITSGVVVNWHYCMGDLASIQLGAKASDHCSKCGMKDKKGCCETEYRLFKVQDEHQWSKTVFSIDPLTEALPTYTSVLTAFTTDSSPVYECYHAPPSNKGNELYLHHNVFRI